MEGNLSKCAFCGKFGRKKCTKCHSVVYCDRKCQQKHYKVHKKECPKLAEKLTRMAESRPPLLGPTDLPRNPDGTGTNADPYPVVNLNEELQEGKKNGADEVEDESKNENNRGQDFNQGTAAATATAANVDNAENNNDDYDVTHLVEIKHNSDSDSNDHDDDTDDSDGPPSLIKRNDSDSDSSDDDDDDDDDSDGPPLLVRRKNSDSDSSSDEDDEDNEDNEEDDSELPPPPRHRSELPSRRNISDSESSNSDEPPSLLRRFHDTSDSSNNNGESSSSDSDSIPTLQVSPTSKRPKRKKNKSQQSNYFTRGNEEEKFKRKRVQISHQLFRELRKRLGLQTDTENALPNTVTGYNEDWGVQDLLSLLFSADETEYESKTNLTVNKLTLWSLLDEKVTAPVVQALVKMKNDAGVVELLKSNADQLLDDICKGNRKHDLIGILDLGVTMTSHCLINIFKMLPSSKGDQFNNKVASIIVKKCEICMESKGDLKMIGNVVSDRVGKQRLVLFLLASISQIYHTNLIY